MSSPNKYGANRAKALLVAEAPPQTGIYITDTATYTGNFTRILVLAAAVGALVSDNIQGTLTGVVMPVGVEIEGRFSSITLASGKVIAYVD